MQFDDGEGRVLHGLIEDRADDIVVRLDARGFIVHASVNAVQLGLDLHSHLVMPHISDLAAPDFAADVASHVRCAFAGEVQANWIEFPLRSNAAAPSEQIPPTRSVQRWYAFRLRVMKREDGRPAGALGLLCAVRTEHVSAGGLAADPDTGLASRPAFCAALARAIAGGEPHSMAIFAIDRMRALFMQYGQATADEIRWGFARFLETMTAPQQQLAQLDEERFAVLLPGMRLGAGREWANDVLDTFAGLITPSDSRTAELTASAGLARAEKSVDWTLRQAELGLVMARAGGGMRAAVSQPISGIACGASVERAMEAAVQRALRLGEERRA